MKNNPNNPNLMQKIMRGLHRKRGFTLFEILIVTGIMAVLLPVLFVIVYTTLRQEAKINAIRQVKLQGDAAKEVMVNLIKNNAYTIYNTDPGTTATQVCASANTSYTTTPSTTMYFHDQNNDVFSFILSTTGTNTVIASRSSLLATPLSLTATPITISNFTLSCTKTSDNVPPFVTISYQAGYSNVGACTSANQVCLNYSVPVEMRNAQ